MIHHPSKIILGPRITDRAYKVSELANYAVFKVLPSANKQQIKAAVEQLFQVKVKAQWEPTGGRIILALELENVLLVDNDGNELSTDDKENVLSNDDQKINPENIFVYTRKMKIRSSMLMGETRAIWMSSQKPIRKSGEKSVEPEDIVVFITISGNLLQQ